MGDLWLRGIGFAFISLALAFWNLGVVLSLIWCRSAVAIAAGAVIGIFVLMILLADMVDLVGYKETSLVIGMCAVYGPIAVISHLAARRRFQRGDLGV